MTLNERGDVTHWTIHGMNGEWYRRSGSCGETIGDARLIDYGMTRRLWERTEQLYKR